jgi:hypothetical protein
LNATELRARFSAQRLAAAITDEERAKRADALLDHGEPGARKLAECVKAGEEPLCAAAVAAFEKHLSALPENDPRAVVVAAAVLDVFPAATDPGKRAVLQLLPTILNRTGSVHVTRCRGIVSEGLKTGDVGARLASVRLTMHPDIRLRGELGPLLAAPEPEIRAAALVAVASATDGEVLINDEELFRWLHDPDASVRKVCRDALIARDRSDAEIALGRRLTHPDPSERLKLLLDLRYDDVADPEPWLERLSRDPEPAVRAGSARVAVEVALARHQSCPAWVARVASADAHPTVRFVAAYYRAKPASVPPPAVRPAGGP